MCDPGPAILVASKRGIIKNRIGPKKEAFNYAKV